MPGLWHPRDDHYLMNERDFRINILQGYINIQRIARQGEPTKYLLLLVSVTICVFGIAPQARSGLKTAADVVLAISAAIFIALIIAVSRISSILERDEPTYEQLATELRTEQRRANIRHRLLQVAAGFFMFGLLIVMVGVSLSP